MRRASTIGAIVGTALVLAAAGGPAAAAPSGGVIYRGKTSQSWKLKFKVSGNRVRAFASSVTLSCSQGGANYTVSRPFLPPGAAKIKPDGRFRRTVSPGNGTTYKYKGRIQGRTAKGTLTMGSTKIVFGGTEVCVTIGTVRWKARRR
jgi:hypothetical protein